jgi:hypothetical protein
MRRRKAWLGTPHARGAGYLINGINKAVPEEADIQTCPHCGQVINLQVWRASATQSFCTKCMKPTCDNPVCIQDCNPVLKQHEEFTRAQYKAQQAEKAAGAVPPRIIIP